MPQGQRKKKKVPGPDSYFAKPRLKHKKEKKHPEPDLGLAQPTVEHKKKKKATGPDSDLWACTCSDGEILYVDVTRMADDSGYFAAMVHSNMRETSQKKIDLQLISSQIAKFLLKMYKHQKPLNVFMLPKGDWEFPTSNKLDAKQLFISEWWLNKMEEILKAVDYLDMPVLLPLCSKMLLSILSDALRKEKGILQVWQIAFEFGLEDVQDAIASDLALRVNMLKLSYVHKHLPFELFKKMMACPNVNCGKTELDIFKTIKEWILEDKEDRLEYLEQLVDCLHMPSLLHNDLKAVDSILEELGYFDINLAKMFSDYSRNPHKYFLERPEKRPVRNGSDLILFVGGKEGKGPSRSSRGRNCNAPSFSLFSMEVSQVRDLWLSEDVGMEEKKGAKEEDGEEMIESEMTGDKTKVEESGEGAKLNCDDLVSCLGPLRDLYCDGGNREMCNTNNVSCSSVQLSQLEGSDKSQTDSSLRSEVGLSRLLGTDLSGSTQTCSWALSEANKSMSPHEETQTDLSVLSQETDMSSSTQTNLSVLRKFSMSASSPTDSPRPMQEDQPLLSDVNECTELSVSDLTAADSSGLTEGHSSLVPSGDLSGSPKARMSGLTVAGVHVDVSGSTQVETNSTVTQEDVLISSQSDVSVLMETSADMSSVSIQLQDTDVSRLLQENKVVPLQTERETSLSLSQRNMLDSSNLSKLTPDLPNSTPNLSESTPNLSESTPNLLESTSNQRDLSSAQEKVPVLSQTELDLAVLPEDKCTTVSLQKNLSNLTQSGLSLSETDLPELPVELQTDFSVSTLQNDLSESTLSVSCASVTESLHSDVTESSKGEFSTSALTDLSASQKHLSELTETKVTMLPQTSLSATPLSDLSLSRGSLFEPTQSHMILSSQASQSASTPSDLSVSQDNLSEPTQRNVTVSSQVSQSISVPTGTGLPLLTQSELSVSHFKLLNLHVPDSPEGALSLSQDNLSEPKQNDVTLPSQASQSTSTLPDLSMSQENLSESVKVIKAVPSETDLSVLVQSELPMSHSEPFNKADSPRGVLSVSTLSDLSVSQDSLSQSTQTNKTVSSHANLSASTLSDVSLSEDNSSESARAEQSVSLETSLSELTQSELSVSDSKSLNLTVSCHGALSVSALSDLSVSEVDLSATSLVDLAYDADIDMTSSTLSQVQSSKPVCSKSSMAAQMVVQDKLRETECNSHLGGVLADIFTASSTKETIDNPDTPFSWNSVVSIEENRDAGGETKARTFSSKAPKCVSSVVGEFAPRLVVRLERLKPALLEKYVRDYCPTVAEEDQPEPSVDSNTDPAGSVCQQYCQNEQSVVNLATYRDDACEPSTSRLNVPSCSTSCGEMPIDPASGEDSVIPRSDCNLDQTCYDRDTEDDMLHPEARGLSYLKCPIGLIEFGMCLVDNFLYIAGGQRKDSGNARFAVRGAYKLDPHIGEWTEITPLTEQRCLFYLGSAHGNIYAVGGCNRSDELKSVEAYSLEELKWKDGPEMPIALHEHAGCVVDNKVYVCGGHDGTSQSDILLSLESAEGPWVRKSSMLQARSYHIMAHVEEKIFILGGAALIDGNVQDIFSCESYDILTDQWTHLVDIDIPIACCLGNVIDDYIMCTGGYSFNGVGYLEQCTIFDTKELTCRSYPLIFSKGRHCEGFFCIRMTIAKRLLK